MKYNLKVRIMYSHSSLHCMCCSLVHLLIVSICRAHVHANVVFSVIFFELAREDLVLALVSNVWVEVSLDFLNCFYIHVDSSALSLLLNCNALLLVELLVWGHY